MMLIFKIYILILSLLILSSCGQNAEAPKEGKAIARVNSNYLYYSDIEGIGSGLSSEDSARQLALYIDKWAADQIMLDLAKKNLNVNASKNIERLVNAYKNSLIISAYEEVLIQNEMDTVVSQSQISAYFKENQDQYISGHDWIRCHFIRVRRNMPDLDNLRNWFKSGEKNDFEKVKQYCLSKEGINFVLDSEQWVNLEKIGEMLPEGSVDASKLQTDRTYDRTDNEYLYLLRVFELRDRNSPLPLAQVQGEIVKIILQQRRSEILQKLRNSASEKVKSGKVFEKF
jgi:cupin superfamily acireductone dioxygenase involved in methionine salvage